MKSNNSYLLQKVTRKLLGGRSTVTLNTWRDSLERHPQYPSMQSLSDTLHRWGFDNAALQLSVEQLAELPYPYIAHFRDKGGKFIGVLDRKEDRFRITDGPKEYWIELGVFEKNWSGAVLLVEPKEKNGDPDYTFKRKVEVLQSLRLPVLIGGLTFVILSTLTISPLVSLSAVLFILLSLVGLGLSITLVSLHLEGRGSPAQKFCQTSDNTDCHSVLDSPAAKLFGLFSWAELGMLYFGFQLIFLLIGIISQQVALGLYLLTRLSWLAFFYIPFSIYYQARIIRKWCRFCLGVLAILFLQVVIGFAIGSFSFQTLPAFPYVPFFWGVVLPMILWLIIKPYWIDSIRGREAIRDIRRFQSNEKLFAEMLASQPTIPPIPENAPIFRYGNPEATNTITVVTNPFCTPCARMHERIDKLLAANPFIKVEVIVLTGNDPNEKHVQLVALWLALQEKGHDVRKAMEGWYKLQTKDVDSYAQDMSDTVDESHREKVLALSQWVNIAKINSTPTVLLNGRRIPEPFQVEDLNYILNNELAVQIH